MRPVNAGINVLNDSIRKNSVLFCCIIGLMFVSTAGREHNNHKYNISENFISYETLMDGETEKLIHFNGLTAKETSVRPQGDSSS